MTNTFSSALTHVAQQDVQGLEEARTHYGDSWRKRGGVGAFMMLARKWDRLETILEKGRPDVNQYDVLEYIRAEVGNGKEGVLDSVRDLRRYLMLVEAHLVETGVSLPLSRDNQVAVDEMAGRLGLNDHLGDACCTTLNDFINLNELPPPQEYNPTAAQAVYEMEAVEEREAALWTEEALKHLDDSPVGRLLAASAARQYPKEAPPESPERAYIRRQQKKDLGPFGYDSAEDDLYGDGDVVKSGPWAGLPKPKSMAPKLVEWADPETGTTRLVHPDYANGGYKQFQE
jgi:hypothetical protein